MATSRAVAVFLQERIASMPNRIGVSGWRLTLSLDD